MDSLEFWIINRLSFSSQLFAINNWLSHKNRTTDWSVWRRHKWGSCISTISKQFDERKQKPTVDDDSQITYSTIFMFYRFALKSFTSNNHNILLFFLFIMRTATLTATKQAKKVDAFQGRQETCLFVCSPNTSRMISFNFFLLPLCVPTVAQHTHTHSYIRKCETKIKWAKTASRYCVYFSDYAHLTRRFPVPSLAAIKKNKCTKPLKNHFFCLLG